MEIINSIADKFNDEVNFHIIGGTESDINTWKKKLNKKCFLWSHLP